MKRVALVSCLLITLAAAPASAECAMSQAFVAPSADELLPPNPTLFVFARDYVDASVRSATPMTLGPREVFGQIAVRRVRFAVRRGSFTVTVGGRPHRYRVDPSWRRSEPRPVLGTRADVESAWMCSFTDAVQIGVESVAPAFEVRWAGGRTIVPARIGGFWGGGSRSEPMLHLGHVSCLGFTVDGGARPRADVFEVTALYPDGSRATVEGGRANTSPEPPAVDLSLPAPRFASHATTVMTSPPSRWPIALALFGGALGGLLLARRLRAGRRGLP